MYWRIESFPELEHLAPEDRQRLVRSCMGLRHRVRWLGNSLIFGIFVWIIVQPIMYAVGVPGRYVLWFAGAAFVLGTAAAFQVHLIQIRGQLLIYLEQMARKQRLPMCLVCGYDLTGNATGRCPECGARLHEGAVSSGNEAQESNSNHG